MAVAGAKAALVVLVGALFVAAWSRQRGHLKAVAGGLPLALAITAGLVGGITNAAQRSCVDGLPARITEHLFERRSSGRLGTCPRINSSCAARANTTSRTSRSPSRATGWSSSPACPAVGKSSLAFDTIYAEGQRRYVESLSAYARQFLGQMEKPDVDQIDGLSPAISIDQKGASRNPRSTVGTVTEIYDHLRLLFARIGIPHCPNGHAIERQTRPADRRPGPGAARGDPTARPRAAHQGPQDRGRPGLRRRPAAGLRPRPGRRRDGRHRRRAQARQVQAPHDRGRRRPLHRPPRRGARGRRAGGGRPARSTRRRAWSSRIRMPARLADSVETALRLGEGVVLIAPAPRDDEAAGVRGAALQRAVQLPVRRVHDRRARAARASRSTRRTAPARAAPASGPSSRSIPTSSSRTKSKSLATGALVPWARDADRRVVAAEDPRGDLRVARLGLPTPGARPAGRGARVPPVRGEGREGRRPLPPRARREHVQRHLRGRRHQPRAALPRDRLGLHQDRAREVHGHPAMPGLRRQAAPPGGPRR